MKPAERVSCFVSLSISVPPWGVLKQNLFHILHERAMAAYGDVLDGFEVSDEETRWPQPPVFKLNYMFSDFAEKASDFANSRTHNLPPAKFKTSLAVTGLPFERESGSIGSSSWLETKKIIEASDEGDTASTASMSGSSSNESRTWTPAEASGNLPDTTIRHRSQPNGSSNLRPGSARLTVRKSLFATTTIDAPEDTVRSANIESHFGGAEGPAHLYKIFTGSPQVIWLTSSGRLIVVSSAGRLEWDVSALTLCRRTDRFRHGSMDISGLGPLLEIEGRCVHSETPVFKTSSAIHIGVRGLGAELDEWVSVLQSRASSTLDLT